MATIDHDLLVQHWKTLSELNFDNTTVDTCIKQLIQHWKQTAPVAIRSQFYQIKTIQSWANCNKCTGVDSSVKVFGKGPSSADVAIIGECPAELEIKQGEPFVGPAGEKLNAILASVNIDRAKLFVTNTIVCRASTDNRAPSHAECVNCQDRLKFEIETVKPKAILVAGSIAMGALGINGRITDNHGKVFDTNLGIPGFVMYHPAYLLNAKGDKQQLVRKEMWQDINAFKQYCKERNLNVFT